MVRRNDSEDFVIRRQASYATLPASPAVSTGGRTSAGRPKCVCLSLVLGSSCPELRLIACLSTFQLPQSIPCWPRRTALSSTLLLPHPLYPSAGTPV